MTPCSFGKLQARAVACARSSEGKTPRPARFGQVIYALALVPAPSPFPDRTIRTSNVRSNLLDTPFRMFVCCQHDPRSHYFALWCISGIHKLAQFAYFIFKELYFVLGFWSAHGLFLLAQVYTTTRNIFMKGCTKNLEYHCFVGFPNNKVIYGHV
jgi:hypothetical protein